MIHRMVSICIAGALRTTPSEVLNIMVHLVPLDIVSMQYAACTAVAMGIA